MKEITGAWLHNIYNEIGLFEDVESKQEIFSRLADRINQYFNEGVKDGK